MTSQRAILRGTGAFSKTSRREKVSRPRARKNIVPEKKFFDHHEVFRKKHRPGERIFQSSWSFSKKVSSTSKSFRFNASFSKKSIVRYVLFLLGVLLDKKLIFWSDLLTKRACFLSPGFCKIDFLGFSGGEETRERCAFCSNTPGYRTPAREKRTRVFQGCFSCADIPNMIQSFSNERRVRDGECPLY